MARQYIRGDGIEIGAKSTPLLSNRTLGKINAERAAMKAPPTTVRLVDELSTADLLVKYGGTDATHQGWLRGIRAHPVDVVDDANYLKRFRDESLDFVVANHVLEHVVDFLGTLATFHRVLRKGGVAFVALPDRRFNPEDRNRRTTQPMHHFESLHNEAKIDADHPFEVAEGKLGRPVTTDEEPAALARARAEIAAGASSGMHLHTFTTDSLVSALVLAHQQGELRGLVLTLVQQVANENILVLRKVDGVCPGYFPHKHVPERLPARCPGRSPKPGAAYAASPRWRGGAAARASSDEVVVVKKD